VSSNRKAGVHIAWKTVTYRSVLLAVLGVIAAFCLFVRLAFPDFTQSKTRVVGSFVAGLLEHIAGTADKPEKATSSSQQAHFTAMDGTVRVKKANSNSWVSADYAIPLEKGDVVQTGPEGMAKIAFTDGTNYTVKEDSLIAIEENSANEQQQTNVAVAVSTGTVDLSTSTYVQGSKSAVIVSGATASLSPESAASIHNDPHTDQHEILLKKGEGEVQRNGELVKLADWEKVSFQAESPRMAKVKETGPPTPISPANMMPIFLANSSKPVEFSWTPMANATGYRLRIARNPYFTPLLVDRKVDAADVEVTGLDEGAYYWVVQSFDASGKESLESEKNRFNVIPKGKNTVAVNLELDPLVQHGHVIELIGRTEVGARVMVNGREVPIVSQDGSFHYFTPPLPAGESVITVTAQNSKGGVNTKQEKVVIQ
jgi:hypothetical protein